MSSDFEIRRFGVKSFGKFFACLHLVMGLIAGVLMMIVGIIDAATIPAEEGGVGMSQALISGFLMLTIAPIVYALLGFVFGVLIASVYNTCAKFFGGITFKTK